MRSNGMRRALLGGALLVAVVAISVSAVVFSSRDDSSESALDRSGSTTTSIATSTSLAAPACDGAATGSWLRAVNGDRVPRGVAPLCANRELTAFAQRGADLMAESGALTHRDLNTEIGNWSFSTMGENLYVGPADPSVDAVEATWIASAPHRANILSPAFSAVGVGIATGADGRVWIAVDFAG